MPRFIAPAFIFGYLLMSMLATSLEAGEMDNDPFKLRLESIPSAVREMPDDANRFQPAHDGIMGNSVAIDSHAIFADVAGEQNMPAQTGTLPNENRGPTTQPLSSPAAPAKLLLWSATDIQYLYGFNWNVGNAQKDVVTFEHADGWKYGDNYFFLDVANVAEEAQDTSPYGEWQPRFSLSKITGHDFGKGLVADILETNRLAFGQGFLAHLHGAAVDLNIPGFSYWHQHFFFRDDVHQHGYTWQITSEWSAPITVDNLHFVFDGFIHFIGPEGHTTFNIIAQPQFLLDVGRFWGYDDQVFAGVEVDCRYNEYGTTHKNEVVPQLMIEARF